MKTKKQVNTTIDHGEFLLIFFPDSFHKIFFRNWDAIRSNTEWTVQLHSPSDKLIPVEEGRFVAEKLKSEYSELERRGHFMGKELPEVLKAIKEKCRV